MVYCTFVALVLATGCDILMQTYPHAYLMLWPGWSDSEIQQKNT